MSDTTLDEKLFWEGVKYACEYLGEIGLDVTDTDIYSEAIEILGEK
jgi:hypothetical protein